MDNTSIITQLAKPKDEDNICPSPDKVSNSSLKKHRSRSIFSPFFCCFRHYHDHHVEAPPANNKTHALPPPPEENGGPPKCEQVQLAPPAEFLLPEVSIEDYGRSCVVIDLDETLVHSSFKPISNADFVVPVEIDGNVHQVYVLKRPHVDHFLQKMGELFECVLFTASLAKCLHCKHSDLVCVQCLLWSVRRPSGGPAGPVGGVPRSSLQGLVCVPQRELRQGPESPGPAAQQGHHRGQLARLLHLPPGERRPGPVLV
ncbi:CTD (carboxy-terminal domain, RNA polymerase II, polypeptide A) small phosphatase-like a isoform X5 [Nerophis lumbriciformis]|uniref:CTD (carboxy-terminal domain, RNA polymerase II, polypeptide A) small phosphatase-like a isoform X5 n=1 Tax=Nerophis lumbriciformis TaxID=546530 RepID=UPI002AE08AF6|nr:CTD small phosphatase-like protein isoform X5 [Nerophis lumbriciformis]